MATTGATANSRLQGIDFCRSSAILIAMFSHSIVASGVRDFPTEPGLMPLLVLIHFAAPTFVALFGGMLEVAYLSRLRSGQGQAAVNRLMTRALQCWLLYALAALVFFAIGNSSVVDMQRAVILFGYMPFVSILRFYVYMLLLAPLLLVVRNRIGLTPLLVFAAFVQLAYPLFQAIPSVPEMHGQYYVNYVVNVLYGESGSNQIPSILHGLSLVIFGMAVGNMAQNWLSGDPVRRTGAVRLYVLLLAVTSAATALLWNWSDPGASIDDLAFGVLRGENHPLYYCSAAVGILLAVAVATYLLDVRNMTFAKPVLFAGRTSLFTFSFGNILLFLAPPFAGTLGQAWLYALVLFALICLQSWAFDWLKTARADGMGAAAPLVRWLQGALQTVTGAVSGIVQGVARTYARVLKLA